MPKVKVRATDQLLTAVDTRAQERGQTLSEFYADAIESYLEVTKNASAGAVRSRFVVPRTGPEVVIELPEKLFERAEKAAKRQGKPRHVLYVDAVARKLMAGTHEGSALDEGHGLPAGAQHPLRPS
jgi:metal-responsive CopG/Arc/MetJ family transcriptional regulator